uniref:Uncharacterized protein n=1 Tax=Anguilla anguilla TaxID=7936 RepID=A0A0E9SI39_ANGAN
MFPKIFPFIFSSYRLKRMWSVKLSLTSKCQITI